MSLIWMKKISVKKKVPNCEKKNISKMYEKLKKKIIKQQKTRILFYSHNYTLYLNIIWDHGGYMRDGIIWCSRTLCWSVYIIYLSSICLEIMCGNYFILLNKQYHFSIPKTSKLKVALNLVHVKGDSYICRVK